MSFRLVPKSVTLNDLERRNGVTLRSVAEFMHESVVFFCVYDVVVKKVYVRYLIS